MCESHAAKPIVDQAHFDRKLYELRRVIVHTAIYVCGFMCLVAGLVVAAIQHANHIIGTGLSFFGIVVIFTNILFVSGVME